MDQLTPSTTLVEAYSTDSVLKAHCLVSLVATVAALAVAAVVAVAIICVSPHTKASIGYNVRLLRHSPPSRA